MILTSWDDYCQENWRLAELLAKYKIPAIFFIECDKIEKVAQIKKLAEKGFEIGGHTFTHPPDLKQIDDGALNREIAESKAMLEYLVLDKKPIKWFAYPRGRFDEKVKNCVITAYYCFARTTEIGYGGSAYEKKGFHCFQRREYGGTDWLEYIENMIALSGKNVEIHIWGHAWEIEKNGEWEKLEKLFIKISQKIHD
jgi:peptidoglycan/xylan/chitin deacetylase (PgdA/CDA1 family)